MPKTFLRKAQVAERYNITPRSVERWSTDGRLPKPQYRGVIPLWDQDQLDALDAAAASRTSGKQSGAAA